MKSAFAPTPTFGTNSGTRSHSRPLLSQRLFKSCGQGLLVLGVLICGFAIGWEMAGPSARATGACIALDMVKAHGAIDEVKRKRIVHTLTSISNPNVELFPYTRSELLGACAKLQQSIPYTP